MGREPQAEASDHILVPALWDVGESLNHFVLLFPHLKWGARTKLSRRFLLTQYFSISTFSLVSQLRLHSSSLLLWVNSSWGTVQVLIILNISSALSLSFFDLLGIFLCLCLVSHWVITGSHISLCIPHRLAYGKYTMFVYFFLRTMNYCLCCLFYSNNSYVESSLLPNELSLLYHRFSTHILLILEIFFYDSPIQSLISTDSSKIFSKNSSLLASAGVILILCLRAR